MTPQEEIDSIRAAYAARMNANQHRRNTMTGWCLIALILFLALVGVGIIAKLTA